MDDKIFREKNIKQISSPEDLGDYLHVTTPHMWIIVLGVAIVIVGMIMWSNFVSINSYAYGEGVVTNGILTVTFYDRNTSKYINDSMELIVQDTTIPIEKVGMDNSGNIIAVAQTSFSDGEYEAKA